MEKALSVFLVLILAFTLLQIFVWSKNIKIFIWIYIIGMCLSYIVTFTALNDYIVVVALGEYDENAIKQERTFGTLGNAVTFGITAVYAQSLVVVLLSGAKVSLLERLIGVIALIILTAAVINSGSRTAILGSILLLLGQLWVFSLWRPKRILTMLFWSFIGLLIGGLFLYLMKDLAEVQNRYFQIVESANLESRINEMLNAFFAEKSSDEIERSGNSMELRMHLAKSAWDMSMKNPFGVGLDNFAAHLGGYAHSNYLELLVATGFFGLALYYASYLIIVLKALKVWLAFPSYSRPKALIMCVMVLGLTDVQNVSYYDKTTLLFFVLIIATMEHMRRDIMRSLARLKRKREKQELNSDLSLYLDP